MCPSRPGRPCRERELDRQRHRDVRLRHEHGARLGKRGALALRGRQEAVFRAGRLGRVQPAGDPDRAVRHDPPFHLARGLLRADQDHAERPAALGHVEQDLLDRRVAIAWRVLVQLVEHHEHQRPGGALHFLAAELLPQRDTDHEPLRPVRQVVQVDHGDLGLGRGHRMIAAMAEIAAHNGRQRPHRGSQASQESIDTAGGRAAGHPVPAGVLLAEFVLDQPDELVKRAQWAAVGRGDTVDRHGAVVAHFHRVPPQPGGDLADQHRVLGALVLAVREHEREQFLFAEVPQGPVERADGFVPRADVGGAGRVAGPWWREDLHVAEGGRRQAEQGVLLALFRGEPAVGVVEEQQVLALHAEDQRGGVVRFAAQHTAVEDRVQQERGERRLGRDSGHARDGHVAASGAVHELEVQEYRLAVPTQADRHLRGGHRVEVQRAVPLGAGCPAGGGARSGRHVDLGLDPGHGDLGDLAHLGRQRALVDQEHVGREPGALVAGFHIGDDACDPHDGAVRQRPLGHHDVVELQELVRRHRDGEFQRARRHRAHDQSDRFPARHQRTRTVTSRLCHRGSSSADTAV
jgi:hypothetical protein